MPQQVEEKPKKRKKQEKKLEFEAGKGLLSLEGAPHMEGKSARACEAARFQDELGACWARRGQVGTLLPFSPCQREDGETFHKTRKALNRRGPNGRRSHGSGSLR